VTAAYILAEDLTSIVDESGEPILLEQQETVEPAVPVVTSGGWGDRRREKVREVHRLAAENILIGVPVIGRPAITELFDEAELDNDLLLLAA
jgi:hypothetical protein